MKTEKTYVDSAKFENIVKVLGLEVQVMAAWVKVKGPKGRNVYVAKSVSVGRVTVSGFTLKHEGVFDLGELAFGSVEQELQFEGRTEDEILQAFRDVLEHMTTLGPRDMVRRRRSKSAAGQAASWVQPVASSPASSADDMATELPAAE